MVLETLLAVGIGMNTQHKYLYKANFKEIQQQRVEQINNYKNSNPTETVYTKGNNVNLRAIDNKENVVNHVQNANTELKRVTRLDSLSVVKTSDNQTYYISNDYISTEKQITADLPNTEKTSSGVKSAPKTSGVKSYMPYKAITSTGSPQYKLQQQAYTGTHGIRQVDGRYCVALGSFYTSKIGQKFDLVLENGTVIPCILADQKADKDTDRNNQITSHNGCMSEFVVDSQALDRNAKRMGDISYCEQTWKSPVKQIILY